MSSPIPARKVGWPKAYVYQGCEHQCDVYLHFRFCLLGASTCRKVCDNRIWYCDWFDLLFLCCCLFSQWQSYIFTLSSNAQFYLYWYCRNFTHFFVDCILLLMVSSSLCVSTCLWLQYCQVWFSEWSFSRIIESTTGYTFTLCGILYFWHRHQIEGTTIF